MIKIKDLLDKVRLAWISLISNIKSFFSGSHHKSSADEQYANSNNYGDSNIEETHGENTLESEQEEAWHDALEKQKEEVDDDEFFDALSPEEFEEQKLHYISTKETQPGLEQSDSTDQKSCVYEKGKYYSLQDGLKERTELDNTSQTLALAFEINELIPANCNTDLSKFKLCELKQDGSKYTLILEDDQKNRIDRHSKYLNMYFPPYFEKHSEKKTYAELFSPKENGIINDIIIPLQVPKEVSILTEKFRVNRIKAKIQSCIPDCPADVYLKDCEGHVNFHLNSDDTISLSIKSMKAQAAALLSGTPFETEWPVKDILVRGGFVNTFNNHLNPQSAEGKTSSSFEVLVDITKAKEQERKI